MLRHLLEKPAMLIRRKPNSTGAPAMSKGMSRQPTRSWPAWLSTASVLRIVRLSVSHSQACIRLSVSTRWTCDRIAPKSDSQACHVKRRSHLRQ